MLGVSSRAPAVPVHTRLAFSSLRALTPGGRRQAGSVKAELERLSVLPRLPDSRHWRDRLPHETEAGNEELSCVVARAAGLGRPT